MKLPTSWSTELPGRELFEYAHRVVLRNPDFNLVELNENYPWLVYAMQENLKKLSGDKKLLLPNLHEGETVSVFSDYGGEHPGSKYNTYSFLLCIHSPQPFTERMAVLRKQYGMNNPFKEIKFKKLGHGPTSRLLLEYLMLLDHLVVGVVFTLVVDKRIDTIFGPGKKDVEGLLKQSLREVGMDYLKLPVAEKMLRVLHCSAYLAALLSRDGQKIFWMTDNDSIAATPSKHKDTLALFYRLLKHYSKHDFELVGGATPFAEKSAEFLDLLSVPDIVGGAIESYMSSKFKMGEKLLVSQGVNKITGWLAHQGISMKKYSMILEPDGDAYKCGILNFISKEDNPDATYIKLSF